MDSIGEFHMEEMEGKTNLVYHHKKYHPIPQIESQASSSETASDDQPLFLCPKARRELQENESKPDFLCVFPINSSPEYIPPQPSTQEGESSLSPGRLDTCNLPILPLFWCNNEQSDSWGFECGFHGCNKRKSGADFYFCSDCGEKYHKECVESPPKIKHPYHLQHTLQLYILPGSANGIICFHCGILAINPVYHCSSCPFGMHPTCAMESIPFDIDQSKRHDHPLSLFPRQTSLICNICGFLRELLPTYICVKCNFVAHQDCMNSPHVIKISRHHHRISHTSSLPSGEWSCGVCRRSVDSDYGAYACEKCGDYAVHSRCALRRDIWDGRELKGVPEEDDITQDAGPFDIISDGVILHFLHGHRLELKLSILYDENKICQACVLPIYGGNFYSCLECDDFILHEICASAPRRKQHALHPHPLTLKIVTSGSGYFHCDTCYHDCCGFVYACQVGDCHFQLDVRCASISEPFYYQGHDHPLYLSLEPEEQPTCQVCKYQGSNQLDCIECDFIICFRCATLPYMARYKHNKHHLTVLWGEEICEKDWCEVCERNLRDTCTELFYWCNDCCTTIHVDCLLGEYPYLKPGQTIKLYQMEVLIVQRNNICRPFCHSCNRRCKDKMFKTPYGITCSLDCVERISDWSLHFVGSLALNQAYIFDRSYNKKKKLQQLKERKKMKT